jgi:hypothetical protein
VPRLLLHSYTGSRGSHNIGSLLPSFLFELTSTFLVRLDPLLLPLHDVLACLCTLLLYLPIHWFGFPVRSWMLCRKDDLVSCGPKDRLSLCWNDCVVGIMLQLHPTSCMQSIFMSNLNISLNSCSSPSRFWSRLFRFMLPSQKWSSPTGPVLSPKYGNSSSSFITVLQSFFAHGVCDCWSAMLLPLHRVRTTLHAVIGRGGLTCTRDVCIHLVVALWLSGS